MGNSCTSHHQATALKISPVLTPRSEVVSVSSLAVPSAPRANEEAAAPIDVVDNDEGGSPTLDTRRGLAAVQQWFEEQQSSNGGSSSSSMNDELDNPTPDCIDNDSMANDARLRQAELWTVSAFTNDDGTAPVRVVNAVGLTTPKMAHVRRSNGSCFTALFRGPQRSAFD